MEKNRGEQQKSMSLSLTSETAVEYTICGISAGKDLPPQKNGAAGLFCAFGALLRREKRGAAGYLGRRKAKAKITDNTPIRLSRPAWNRFGAVTRLAGLSGSI